MAALEADGLLLLPVGKDWPHIHQLIGSRMPVVLLDRVRPDLGCPSVGVDNYQMAYQATEYLIEEEHQRIACIQRLPLAWINEERVRGYREAHRNHGLNVEASLVVGDQFGQRNGYLEVKRLLESEPGPTAIFALSHLVTLEALRALQDQGPASIRSFEPTIFISPIRRRRISAGLMSHAGRNRMLFSMGSYD